MVDISQKFNEAGIAPMNLNYKKTNKVGEYLDVPIFIPLNEAPEDMLCFKMSDWLKVIRPKLKEASEYYHDYK